MPLRGPGHWIGAAAEWNQVRAPLRPSTQDVTFFEAAIGEQRHLTSRSQRAMLLGVTVELAACRWPSDTQLLAVDISRAMIQSLWPAAGAPAAAQAIQADWRAMPFERASIDIAVGDGCYAAGSLAEGFFTKELHRVLRPDGMFVIRVFVRPEIPECIEQLRRAVRDRKIANVHILKWRLAHAIQRQLADGVRLGDVWEVFHSMLPEVTLMAGSTGWSEAEIGSLKRYRDNDTRFFFPTLAEFRALVNEYFIEELCSYGDYEMAELCPRFILRPVQ